MLERIKLAGFRSIKEMDLELRPLNVLIGANGAGKSNLVVFFRLLNEMMAGRLQQFISTTGRAQANLHFGPKKTPQIQATLRFRTDNGVVTYFMRLLHAAGDSLAFAEETLTFLQDGRSGEPKRAELKAGHLETRIRDEAQDWAASSMIIRDLLNRCRVYHFHDTSPTARVRQYCYIGDHRWLMPDAGNLAAMLHRWRGENETVYGRIVGTVRQIAPFFADFDLQPEGPNDRDITLNWRHNQSDSVFGPHQLSGGTLRAICLIALLLQPEEDLPGLIVLDEPELGLHPYALHVVASLLQAAAQHAQVLVCTQSSAFLDSFQPEDIVVAELDGGATRFSRPNEDLLEGWLEDYCLGEIWEMNVIGGGPH